MDKARLDAIIAAYGADPRRWPETERDAAVAYAARESAMLEDARSLDALLALAPEPAPPIELLAARILAARTPGARHSPLLALAACIVGGVLIGVGAGLSAPMRASPDMDGIIVAAFEAPFDWEGVAP